MQAETLKTVAARLPKLYQELEGLNDLELKENREPNYPMETCLGVCPHCNSHISQAVEVIYLDKINTRFQLQKFDCPDCDKVTFSLMISMED